MAIADKIISFWKQVRVKSSDMFTLFKVGIGVKVPTHKLHVKDSTDPMKLEGVESDTSSSTKFLVLDGSNVVKHSTGTAKTTEEVQDIVGAMFTSNTETRIAATYEDSDGTIDLVVDAIPVDLTVDGAGTVHTNNITDLHGAGVDGAANQLLTDDGDGTVTSESELSYDSSANTLTIGTDSASIMIMKRAARSDANGARLYIQSGDAGGTNKTGGDLNIIAGRGTGNAAGGSIYFQSSAAGSSGSSLNSADIRAELDNAGNLQIDGGLTVGSTSFVNSSGVVQVATQGTIDHDSLANFVANEHINWVNSSVGTIHSSNIPTLNQNTTGSAQSVLGGTDADVTITSDAGVVVKLNADSSVDASHQKFQITNSSDTEVAYINVLGNLQIDGGLTTGSTSAINSSGLIQVANQSNITGVGTITSGTWQGTAIASAYLDSDTAHLTTTQTFTGAKTFEKKLTLDGNRNITASGDGASLHIDQQTLTDNSTSASGTASFFNLITVENPSLAATNSSVTTTNASTLYIKGAPFASTNQTITNAYSVYVQAGASYFGGAITAIGGVTADVTGNVSGSSGSCTGNAATATALTTGNKDITGTLNVTDIITGKQRHVMRCGFFGSSTSNMYLPFNYGGTFESTSSSGYLEYGGVVMPADGYVESVIIRSENACGNSTVAIHVASTGTEVPSASPGSFASGTVNMSADDTAYKFTGFANLGGDSNSFSAGDVVMISFDPTSTSSDTTATAVLVLDWNNAL